MAGGRRRPQQRHGLRVAAWCLAVLPTSLSSDQGISPALDQPPDLVSLLLPTRTLNMMLLSWV